MGTRINEHQRDVDNEALTTSLSRRAYQCRVSVLWEEAQVVKPVRDKKQGFTAEALTIFRKKLKGKAILNDDDPSRVNCAWRWCVILID